MAIYQGPAVLVTDEGSEITVQTYAAEPMGARNGWGAYSSRASTGTR
jgi:hypothetical protein